MSAALDSYLYAILEIAATIEAISPEIGPGFRAALIALRSRLSAESTVEQLEESRAVLHEILQSFSDKIRLQNQALARELNQTLSMVTRTEDASAGRNIQHSERLVDFLERLESAARSGELGKLASH